MVKSSVNRRLAAILAADVVEYSRLMGEDETGTLERLKSLRKELVQPKIFEFNGRIVKLMGDGLLAEFSSVVEAVQCAVEIQQSITMRDTDLADDHRIRLRIGVNLGDIIVEGSDIYGDGVNIAARLEGLSSSGGICISRNVFEEVRYKLPLDFEDLGEKQVKNIMEPVRVYCWTENASESRPSALDEDEVTPLPEKPSIAVLPFQNMSGDTEQEYFSDGITEDIITALSHFKELSVVSRSSTFVFKNKATPLREIGEKLNVHYIVEGSIRKAGNKVRVSAQLIDATNDSHIWADRYDRDLKDIFDVQDDVVRRVTSTLVGRLEHERTERTMHKSQSQLEAYDLYLRGREHFFNLSIEDNTIAKELVDAAITLEPEYAAALALYSEILLRMWLNGWSDDTEENLANSFNSAKRANNIDDQDSRVHTALGMAYIFQRNLNKAKYHFETALKLNPNDTRALVYYSRQALFDGDTEKALTLSDRALNLNPYGKYNYNLGIACFVSHRYQEAVELLDSIGNPPAVILALLAASYAMTDNTVKARSTSARFADAAQLCPGLPSPAQSNDWQKFFSSRWPFHNPEDLRHLLGAFGKAGLTA